MRLDCSLGRGMAAHPSARLRASQEQREVQALTAFTKLAPAALMVPLSQLFGKCNINHSPADLPPRLLVRCFGEQLRTADAKREENAARKFALYGNRPRDFRYGLK